MSDEIVANDHSESTEAHHPIAKPDQLIAKAALFRSPQPSGAQATARLTLRDVRLGSRCIAVEQCNRGAVARLADGSEVEADVVVGADGIHSVVRKSLFGSDAPRFTGCICWRGMAAFSAVPGHASSG